MLDTETRRRIDTARDILVGKVPDPKSQVEQITIALIYKFMDDMDAEAEEFGGERSFFDGEFARYGWANLMRGGLSGHDVLNLYADAVTRMPENPGIPPLFRDIFNNAYLPYRDPETLRAFLKVIDEFTYDHSERLGDAFEYLLSVLGSQGDAGQFRTPRHIIDFIVAIIDPKKDETILDPACGTAGFLISSWKHIAKANTDEKGNSALTPDERGRLARNFSGYDISPDMVRLSLVNMYLHRITQPRIHEYDTLTNEDRWNEYADVILANPPFMSPKGGIRPHNRFSVQSKRSEVLFVDYMAEHLTPEGRAGIIVPEGIIFQSQNAHRQLRRMLVEDYLVAVISLPAGVFNPYSGVKTSVLILDKKLAKQADHIAFYKVENDGYDLGAQRREIEKNDLPRLREELSDYLEKLRVGNTANALESEPAGNVAEQGVTYATESFESSLGLVVTKEKIAADGEYNLGGERYRESSHQSKKYAWASIGSIVKTITPPVKIPKVDYAETGQFPIIDQSQNEIAGWTDDASTVIKPNKPMVIFGDHTCIVKLTKTPFAQGADGIKILKTIDTVDPRYLYHTLRVRPIEVAGYQRHFSVFKRYEIPIPPLEVQLETVSEIEVYQRVIDGAQAVIDNYSPGIKVDPKWPMVELGSMVEIVAGQSPPGKSYNNSGIGTPFYQGKTEFGCVFLGKPSKWTTDPKRFAQKSDILMSVRAPVGPVNIATQCICIGRGLAAIRPIENDLDKMYAFWILHSLQEKFSGSMGTAFASVNMKEIGRRLIPLPPIDIQRKIVEEIESERESVAATKNLLMRMNEKIRLAINGVWNSDG